MTRKIQKVDLHVQIPKEFNELSDNYLSVLKNIDSLYTLQLEKNLSKREESELWLEIPKQLRSVPSPNNKNGNLEQHLQKLERGIYDLYPITTKSKQNEIDLVIGKVFTSEGENTSYYSGVAGVANKSYQSVLEQFDSKLDMLCRDLLSGALNQVYSIKDKAPVIRCLDVFSLNGALNVAHKPICIFFSGDNPENISALSNMTVFINLYTERFKALTQEISKKYLSGTLHLEALSDQEISNLLLIWLRGHDVGHFIGEDKLGDEMSQFEKDYMILHELKSDMIALYSFRLYRDDLLGGELLGKIYLLTIAEMLRYIRRGNIIDHPDSASAYLAWCYFEQSGAITYDPDNKVFSVDIEMLEDSVSVLTNELLRIFKEGDIEAARGLAGQYGSLENASNDDYIPADCPENLRRVASDISIAYFLEYDFSA